MAERSRSPARSRSPSRSKSPKRESNAIPMRILVNPKGFNVYMGNIIVYHVIMQKNPTTSQDEEEYIIGDENSRITISRKYGSIGHFSGSFLADFNIPLNLVEPLINALNKAIHMNQKSEITGFATGYSDIIISNKKNFV